MDETTQMVTMFTGPAGALALAAYVLRWFMVTYRKEQERSREHYTKEQEITRETLGKVTSALDRNTEAFGRIEAKMGNGQTDPGLRSASSH